MEGEGGRQSLVAMRGKGSPEIKVNTVSAAFFDATYSNYIRADIFHHRGLSEERAAGDKRGEK